MQNVAVFWDYENCPAPSNASGYTLVSNIRAMAQMYGVIKSLRAYTAVSEQFSTAKAAVLRSELQCSGVSLVDCPHNGRKDVADKMIIVDMLAHAIDNSPSSTVILLISGDRDFAYAMSILRLRCYNLVLCAPSNAHASLLAQASDSIDWASITVPPGSCINAVKQYIEEREGTIGSGFMPSTPRFRGGTDHYPPPNDVGIIVNPYMRHTVKHSGSFSSDARGSSGDFGRPVQDYTPKPPNNQMKYISQQNSYNSAYSSVQDSPVPVINAAGCSPHHAAIMTDKPLEQETHSAPNKLLTETPETVSTMAIPLILDSSAEVRGVSTPVRRATPETVSQRSGNSSLAAQIMYQLPVTTQLVVNQQQPIDSSPIQTESAELSNSPHASTTDTTSNTATCTVQEASVPPEISPVVDEKPSGLKSPFFTVSESGAAESVTSSTSAYVTAATQSAPASPGPEPVRLTPPTQFKALVRILQLHRSRGLFMPTRSLVASHLVLPANGNPYKQAGVGKWAQYAELARKAGIVELGGWEGAAWVKLTPKWYDANAM